MKQNTKINIKNTKKNTKIKKNTRLRKRTYKKVKNTKTNRNMRKNKKGGGRGEKRPRDENEDIVYDYAYDNTYNDFLNDITFINENDEQCRSTRSNNLSMRVASLGSTDKKDFKSTKPLDYDDVYNFVNDKYNITDGPQIVSIPVSPYRHAFFVNVLPDKIMISDWRGNEKLIGRQPRGGADWSQYYYFIDLLKDKFPGRRINFYIVNQDLKIDAVKKNEEFDGGGCSEYIYRWVEGILLNDKKKGTNFFSM
jgi:hypothetical protein